MASTFETKGRPSRQDALDYHSGGRKGKIEIVPTKPVATSRDLSLAYSPGVAEPCLEIASDKDLSYKYTIRGNLVGVISNGTAVLGLGDIGAWAAKPVMEGKGVLFKKFADIDVFDLEVNVTDIEAFCTVVKSLEPTFGGINLEDVKSPECFVIERRLRASMGIPVFHDDQHGTAIISAAALLNALELVEKPMDRVKVVFVVAGAAAVACAAQYLAHGVRANSINEQMKLAASRALAHLARQDVPESVSAAYGGQSFRFGREYIIPKPFDPRVLTAVAPEVAQAAMDSGAARIRVDRAEYVEQLRKRQGRTYEVMSVVVGKARRKPTRIAFPEGNHPRILRAAQILVEERICRPVLMGKREEIVATAAEAGLSVIADLEIVDPLAMRDIGQYAQRLYMLRQRHGLSFADASCPTRQ